MNSIFQYTDFRKFLRDRYQEKKKAIRGYTYEYIAAKAGFKSPGYFSQVLSGTTRLTDRLIPAIADVMGLTGKEKSYFQLMVSYNQAAGHEEKRNYFSRMLSAGGNGISMVSPEQFELFDKWYYSAVRAVISVIPFDGNYQKLTRIIIPQISLSEARKAVELLHKLNIIEKTPDNTWQLTSKHLTTGEAVESVYVNNYMLNSMEISRDALYRFSRDERKFSALTVTVSPEGYRRIAHEAEKFRNMVVAIVRADKKMNRAYQVNMQIFPLSHPVAIEKDGL
jgi:uncharacterized protein (TIGR02147 family)